MSCTPGEIPGNGCLASPLSGKKWRFRTALAGETGDGTAYPVGISLDELMNLYWRWRKLKISYNVTLGGFATSSDVTAYRETANGTPLNDEVSMIKSQPWEVVFDDQVDPVSGAPYPAATKRIELAILDDVNRAVLHTSPNYFPSINFKLDTFELGDEALGLYSPRGLAMSHPQVLQSSLHQTISLSLKIGTTTYSIPLWTSDAADTGTITIEASEYWPHEKLTGGAKFNTETGARL